MELETKYNVNDKLWIIKKGQLNKVVIAQISLNIYGIAYNPKMNGAIDIVYHVRNIERPSETDSLKELELYTTKQKAGEAWMKSQGLNCGVSIAD